jgi:hypothetical protein
LFAGYEILQYNGIVARRAVFQDGNMGRDDPLQEAICTFPTPEHAAAIDIPTLDIDRVTQAVASACSNSVSQEWPNHARLAAVCQETLSQSALAVKENHPRIAAVLEEASRDASLHGAFAQNASYDSVLSPGDASTSNLIQADIQQLRKEITELQAAQRQVIEYRERIKHRHSKVLELETAATADELPVQEQCDDKPLEPLQVAVASQNQDPSRALQVSYHFRRW